MPFIMKEFSDLEEFEKWKKEQEAKKKPKKINWTYPLSLFMFSSWGFIAGYLFAIWK